MSLTSYRAAPPRVIFERLAGILASRPGELPGVIVLPFLGSSASCERAGAAPPRVIFERLAGILASLPDELPGVFLFLPSLKQCFWGRGWADRALCCLE
jgi:hypothetical protein